MRAQTSHRQVAGWTVAAAAAMLAALASGAGALAQAIHQPVPELGDICRAYDDLRASLNTRTLSGQVRIRSAAARLAYLAERYPNDPARFGQPIPAIAFSLRQYLDAPYMTARDVFVAACPAADACGEGAQCREAARLDLDR